MSKRYYFPNGIIKDDRLPFEIQITTGLKVYYSFKGKTQLFKADSLYSKKTQTLNICIDDYNIIVTGRKKQTNEQKVNKETGGFIYTIKHKGVELENQTTDKQENKSIKTKT